MSFAAVADSKGRFVLVECAGFGKQADSGVFQNSALGKILQEQQHTILPKPVTLPGTEMTLPYVLLADKGYGLKDTVMRPYSEEKITPKQKLYNFMHNRARRHIECAFGRLTKMFELFKAPLDMKEEKLDIVILACFLIYNIILDKETLMTEYETSTNISSLEPLPPNDEMTGDGERIREAFAHYFDAKK